MSKNSLIMNSPRLHCQMDIHPLLVAAVKAEYIRALEAKDLLESQSSATWVDPLVEAKAELVAASYEAHPEFLLGSMSIRQLLLRMFDNEEIVDGALRVVWADTRCFESSGGDAAPGFKGLSCTNNADEDDATPLAIAIIGCGQMGWTQAINAAIDPCFSVTWAVDVFEASAKKLAAMPALADAPPRVSTDYREALADVGLDAVLVLTPPSTHKEISVAALRAGKHVCCEKPLCLSMEEADEMVKVSEDSSPSNNTDGSPSNPVFFLAYPRRFGIDDHQIINTIKGTLGQPVFYRDVWGVVKGHVSEVIHEETGGGGLLFENSHTLDSYNLTFGKPVKVFAIAEKFKPDPNGTRAKDTYMLTIFYESGDKVVFSSSWAAPGMGDRPWTPYGRLIRPMMDIIGPRGLLHYPAEDPEFKDEYVVFAPPVGPGGAPPPPDTEYEESKRFVVRNDHGEGFARELKHFHECVRGREKSLCGARDGAMVLAIIHAAHKSAASGMPEAIQFDHDQPRL
jgi:predicted dehydrogenase